MPCRLQCRPASPKRSTDPTWLTTSLTSVVGFGGVALEAVGGVASAGGLARAIIATATTSMTILEGVLVAARGRPVLRNGWQGTIERGYEMCTLVAQGETARLQHITGQEMPRQRKSIGEIRSGWFYFPIPQERRQP
jgi:hypothetical protein